MSTDSSVTGLLSDVKTALHRADMLLNEVWFNDKFLVQRGSNRTDESEEANEFMEQISVLQKELLRLNLLINDMEGYATDTVGHYNAHHFFESNTKRYFYEKLEGASKTIESLWELAEDVDSVSQRLIASERIEKSFEDYRSFTEYNEYVGVARQALRDAQVSFEEAERLARALHTS